jgi:tetratricopeptide (TPR) repeat protein
MEAFEAAAGRVLAVDPALSGAFLLTARVLEDRRRFAEAVDLSRRATEVDPSDPDAWFSLGRNLLNLGREEEAKEALEKASRADPWRSIFRENFRKVLDALDDYATGGTENFEIRIHAGEDAALRPLYERALERSFEDLRKRYGYTPETPILLEVFRDAQDFSARTLGVPGFGAVGACFGRVVTLDSPGALPPGTFAWRSTAHHELAHVFHLQMTRGRVPRWFTEGLAVHEERVASDSWVRNMDRDLVSALANGEVLGLLEIDGAFRGPSIMWAYYQGGLMCDWLERDFGMPKILEMLRLYGEDLGNAAVVERALGLTPEAFDAAFLRYCERLTEGWRLRPAWSDAKYKEFRRRSDAFADLDAHLHYAEACLQREKNIDAGTALARARAVDPDHPFLTELRGVLALSSLKSRKKGIALIEEAFAKGRDHFEIRMILAADAERAGRVEEAVEHWRKAKLWFPRAYGPADPRRELARVLGGLGRADEAVGELEEKAAIAESDLDTRLQLAAVYEGRGDHAGVARVLGEAVDILPIPGRDARGRPSTYPAAEVHARLGRALAALDRKGAAADAFLSAVVVGRTQDPRRPDEEVAGWLVEQARAARDAGRSFEARASASEALRLDPANAEAAELLRSLQK